MKYLIIEGLKKHQRVKGRRNWYLDIPQRSLKIENSTTIQHR
jgi:hypothetical protein